MTFKQIIIKRVNFIDVLSEMFWAENVSLIPIPSITDLH